MLTVSPAAAAAMTRKTVGLQTYCPQPGHNYAPALPIGWRNHVRWPHPSAPGSWCHGWQRHQPQWLRSARRTWHQAVFSGEPPDRSCRRGWYNIL